MIASASAGWRWPSATAKDFADARIIQKILIAETNRKFRSDQEINEVKEGISDIKLTLYGSSVR
jgi:hypothetical protein